MVCLYLRWRGHRGWFMFRTEGHCGWFMFRTEGGHERLRVKRIVRVRFKLGLKSKL